MDTSACNFRIYNPPTSTNQYAVVLPCGGLLCTTAVSWTARRRNYGNISRPTVIYCYPSAFLPPQTSQDTQVKCHNKHEKTLVTPVTNKNDSRRRTNRLHPLCAEGGPAMSAMLFTFSPPSTFKLEKLLLSKGDRSAHTTRKKNKKNSLLKNGNKSRKRSNTGCKRLRSRTLHFFYSVNFFHR